MSETLIPVLNSNQYDTGYAKGYAAGIAYAKTHVVAHVSSYCMYNKVNQGAGTNFTARYPNSASGHGTSPSYVSLYDVVNLSWSYDG